MKVKKLKNKLVFKPFFDPEKLTEAGYDSEHLEERLMQQVRELATFHAESDLTDFWEAAHPCHPQYDPEVQFIGPTEVTAEMIQDHVDRIMACLK